MPANGFVADFIGETNFIEGKVTEVYDKYGYAESKELGRFKIELDKASEKKEELKRRPGLTTQLPSAMIYLLYGLYSDIIKKELSSYPDDLPENLTI